ncbi:MAG: bifunctional phosphopantothenoylcysteine decarboxylase/phosphopantothenate--cysteine ligase CoaBC [Nitrososphaerales archaeon]
MREHPSKDIVGSDGSELDGKKIVLCVTASVAAYKAVDLARLLMRHAADVYAVMSKSTKMLLTPELMQWATGRDVVTELTWKLEHIQLAHYARSDLIVIYPCTGNTISKIANGIDDTPVTSVASVALGSKIPIVIAPAMHEAMYENPILQKNMEALKGLVEFVDPNFVEGKAKIADPETVLNAVLAKMRSNSKLKGKKILVTAGATIEFIDPIRVVTNPASGKLGAAIAKEATMLGANLTLIYGHGYAELPRSAKIITVKTSNEMMDAVINELKSSNYDIAIMTAAVSDFKPVSPKDVKIETRDNKQITITLKTTSKIVDQIKKASPGTFLVAFKADIAVSDDDLIKCAYDKMRECNADLMVANDIGRKGSEMGSDTSEVFIIGKNRKVRHLPIQTKRSVARLLLEELASYL